MSASTDIIVCPCCDRALITICETRYDAARARRRAKLEARKQPTASCSVAPLNRSDAAASGLSVDESLQWINGTNKETKRVHETRKRKARRKSKASHRSNALDKEVDNFATLLETAHKERAGCDRIIIAEAAKEKLVDLCAEHCATMHF